MKARSHEPSGKLFLQTKISTVGLYSPTKERYMATLAQTVTLRTEEIVSMKEKMEPDTLRVTRASYQP